ncbi:MAG: peptidyl-prolyl cis-trans isomerase [Magnetospirillum sp.]|nr:peptidyl-prolyl cis-trans isomerase [Magnetospirillum sp.]
MLESFRTFAKTWIAKLFFAILALGFLSWGIGDVVRRGIFGTAPAIQVGGVSLAASDVNAEFKRDVERLQPLFGGKLTTEDARKLGIMDQTIRTIVNRTLVDQAGADLGLTASDQIILRKIAAAPDLRNAKGEFDRQRLEMALARAGLTEKAFVHLQRADMIRGQLSNALAGGVAAPAVLVDPLVAHRQERRIADTVLVKDASIALPAPPDAATLDAYYKANTRHFMAPEYRAVTVLLLRPADVDGQIQVTDAMIRDEYDQRSAEFIIPERRQVSQVVAPDAASADKAAALVKQGKDLPAIAAAVGGHVVDLGNVEKADLPEGLGDSVFAQKPGTVAGPVKTSLGWHIVKVTGITPGHTRALAEVRDQLVQDIRSEKAGDLLTDLSNKVDDALGGGASLEEAAQRFNLQIAKFAAVDAKGRGPDGKPMAGLPKVPAFLEVAFQSDPGNESQLTENGADGYFMLRVDKVTPPAPKPLDSIRAEVVGNWQAEKRHELARAKADAAAAELASGKTAAEVAKDVGGEARTTDPFTRDAVAKAGVPPAIVGEMFDKAVGQTAVAAAQDGWMVARLARIVPFDPATGADAVKTARESVSKQIGGDLIDEYLSALSAKFGVKVDRSQLTHEE